MKCLAPLLRQQRQKNRFYFYLKHRQFIHQKLSSLQQTVFNNLFLIPFEK